MGGLVCAQRAWDSHRMNGERSVSTTAAYGSQSCWDRRRRSFRQTHTADTAGIRLECGGRPQPGRDGERRAFGESCSLSSGRDVEILAWLSMRFRRRSARRLVGLAIAAAPAYMRICPTARLSRRKLEDLSSESNAEHNYTESSEQCSAPTDARGCCIQGHAVQD